MSKRSRSDHSLLICLLALFFINSPLNSWWSELALPWYGLFIPWLVVIGLIAWNQLRQYGGD